MMKGFLIFTAVVSVLIASGCATTSGDGGGSLVVDAPRKYLEAVIVGRVVYNGKGLAGAAVEVKNMECSSVTDAHGDYTLHVKTMTKLGINRMRVQVQASIAGFRTRTRGVYIEQGGTTQLIMELLPSV